MKNIKVIFTFPNGKVIERFLGKDENGYFTTRQTRAIVVEQKDVKTTVDAFTETLTVEQRKIMKVELVDPLPPREKK